jgi:hypothetical protein
LPGTAETEASRSGRKENGQKTGKGSKDVGPT